MSTTIPRANGAVHFTCDKEVIFPSTCSVEMNGVYFTSDSIQVSGKSFAFMMDLNGFTLGGEYPITFTNCGVTTQAVVTIASGTLYEICLM